MEPRVLPRSEHGISRKKIPESALKVLYRLHRAGHKAYLVGGSVRDLLLDITPKDFDVATDARPPEIRRLFRNSRIIGRRFRLAHIYFKDGIIETSTFRRDPDPEAQRGGPDDLLITDDNVFGTPREDAFRRDFTVNALFYSIADYSVIDYVDGIEDLERRTMRVIGEPDLRFQEDPVRMLRACELAGRLGFTIDRATQESIERLADEINRAAAPRVTEEVLQLLRCGSAGSAFQWMLDLGLLDALLPEARAIVVAEQRGLGEFDNLLPVLDRRAAAGDELPEIGLLSALLMPAVLVARDDEERRRGKRLPEGAVRSTIEAAIGPFFERFVLSKLKAEQVVETLLAFDRMLESGWKPQEQARFARKAVFGDAVLLFEVMVEATGRRRDELGRWRKVAATVPRKKPSGKRRPRRRRGRKRTRRK